MQWSQNLLNAWIKFCTQRKRVSRPISCVSVVPRAVCAHLTSTHKHRWKRLVHFCVLTYFQLIIENFRVPWQLISSQLSFSSFGLSPLQTLHFSNNCRCLLRYIPTIVLQMAINWTKLCSSESWSAVSSAAARADSPVAEFCSHSRAAFRPFAKCSTNTSCILRRSANGSGKSSLLWKYKAHDVLSESR